MKKIILASAMLVAFTAASVSSADETSKENKTITTKGGVTFIPNKGTTPPTDPENPGEGVKPGPEVNPPGTTGPLSIDFASSLNFGTNLITSKTETYVARAQGIMEEGTPENGAGKPSRYVPNYVQITDNRGSNSGWTLKVKQNGQFTNKETLNKVLKGSTVTFANPTLNSTMIKTVKSPDAVQGFTLDAGLDENTPGAETLVMSAQNEAGAGTWLDYFGKDLKEVETIIEDAEAPAEPQTIKETVNPAITLTVPGTTPKDAVKYTTSFTWTLSDIPGTGIVEQDEKEKPATPEV
ncbi:WxL domain-containing protein [Vagococcus fessus]|uniref:WxL domain-containing protein n=1 Tax=Vagococcus fessus TaxID=120370 RepID=UPI0039ED20DE